MCCLDISETHKAPALIWYAHCPVPCTPILPLVGVPSLTACRMIQTSQPHTPMGTREHLICFLLQGLSHSPRGFPLSPSKPTWPCRAWQQPPGLWVNAATEPLSRAPLSKVGHHGFCHLLLRVREVYSSPRGWTGGDRNNQIKEINRKIFVFSLLKRGSFSGRDLFHKERGICNDE